MKSAVLFLALCSLLFAPVFPVSAVIFTNQARIEVNDPSGGLSWSNSVGALTVSCWFKLAVPSGATLSDNMTILANRRGGSTNDPHAFHLFYNYWSGNIEFTAKGGSGLFSKPLIERPYIDRWYHVAVVRQGESFTALVDGRQVFSASGNVGDARATDGLSVGGWGNGKYLYGEVQEVAVYQAALDPAFIRQYMYADQPVSILPELRGYFKLGFSTNAADQLKNSALAPVPAVTESGTVQGTAQVVFEEANQAGEQSAFDARRNGGRDALAPLSGAFSWGQTALARPTPGVAFDFRFGYSSANSFGGFKLGNTDPYASGPLGPGWRHTFETRLLPSQDFLPGGSIEIIGLMTWDGALQTWDANLAEGIPDGTYRPRDQEYKGELYLMNNVFEWRTPERLVYRYRHPHFGLNQVMRGRLFEIRDFNSNVVQILYNETRGVITQIVDTVGGRYDFQYKGNFSQLTNVGFQGWSVSLAYDATNRLISKSITNTSGLYSSANTTWQFAYNATNGLLENILDPRGNTNVRVQYDQYGRKTNAVDALARATRTEYNVPANRQMRNTDAAGFQWLETYDRKGHILVQRDPLGNETRYTYDSFGNRTSITEPLGWTTFFGYDDRANAIARTNALGEITRWTFHSFFNKATNEVNALGWTNLYVYDAAGNLTDHSDALGSLVRYTYSTNGLVLTSADANGHVSRFTYDADGFLIARTDPANNTWQFVVNEVGWKLAEINPFNDTTSFAYDLNGNPVQTTDPLNRTFTRQWDANGNLIAQSDGKNAFTRHAYDAANQRIATTNRVGSVWLFNFTLRGKPDRATDPLGNTATNFYDFANRLIAVSDPLGNSITNQYDANGNSVALFDVLGQRWSKTFDRLNRVIAEADPLGDTRSTTFDAAGRIKTITTPNGFPSQHDYDGRGRLVKWTDPENFQWLYAYDGNGNITNITDALNGHYLMTYGPRNERALERNQDNFEWQYTYDRLLRLKTQRDPNGTLRTRKYDKASRVTSLTLSTGREDTYTLDKNDNPEVIDRSLNDVAVATTKLTYDELDRVTRVVDPHSQSVDYGFDALSRVVSVTYPGKHTLTNRYDALSRLTSQVDWAARQMSYDYDKAGRLVRRAYPNGVVQTNTFDSAGRLTGLSHSSLNPQPSAIIIALTYAYDRNGNKVGNTERGTFAWPMPSLTDEASRFTPSGRLIDRSVQNTISNQPSTINYSYDSNGNMTNAAGGGQSWRLTYDEDNRTTSIFWVNGAMNDVLITNRYDALGRRIARKVDGQETRYVLDLSGGMERILCDTTASGQITAYYIHGLDLCYRVDAANNVICYHADAQANIIAVTDGGGTNVAQYAYTPYGRSLGSTNLQSQISSPYLFVGSQGVMEELPGLYFMRARYYSADAGVFLSTDAVKNIGPGWKPVTYQYANANPLQWSDPNGTFAITLGFTLVNMIIESVEIDYDILVRGESVSWGQLGGRFANAALTGATEGAIAEFGGVFFAGPLGRAGSFATKGLANFAGNALEKFISGEGNLNDAAAEAFVDNALTAGMDYLGGNVVGRKPKSLSSMLFGKHAQAGFGNDLLKGTLIGSAKQVGESLGSSKQSVSAQTASVAAPKGSGTTAATSTKPSGASGGGTTSSGAPATTYTVKAGDTLGNIGYKYGTTATAIANANGIKNPNLIRPGQVLKIR